MLNTKKILASIANNWPAKALALALAIALYIFRSMSMQEERFFSVPLIVEGEEALVLSKPYLRMVRISLRGDANSLFPIIESDIEAYLDLEKIDVPGDYRVEVLLRKKGSAIGIEPLEIRVEPTEIDISLDYRISKFVPLIAIFSGETESGYNLDSFSLNPSRVLIEGPAELITNTMELNTDLIELGGRNEDFTTSAAILNRDPFITVRGSGLIEVTGHISRIGSSLPEIFEEEDE